jgi:hypothetical protein
LTFNEGTGRGSSQTIVETFDSLSPFSSKKDEEEDALFLTRVEKGRCMVTVGDGEERILAQISENRQITAYIPRLRGEAGS